MNTAAIDATGRIAAQHQADSRRQARAAALTREATRGTEQDPRRPTTREAEVLALVAAGRTNNETAKQLFMSPETASVHVSRLIAKLGAANRTEAATIARHRGLVL